MKLHLKFSDILIVLSFFVGNWVIQSWALVTQARPGTDEGVYLYQAKLITQGYIPYKDFAMTSHVPFLMYLNALVLKLCNFDMLLYHHLYVAWVFLSVFPIFYTVLYFTKSKWAAAFSIVLFSTFSELVSWDAHFFAIRQASLPFFSFFIYFFFVAKKQKLSQFFLALFSFCLITNFFISLGFGIILLFYDVIVHKKINLRKRVMKYVSVSWLFVLLTALYFGVVLFIPGSIRNLLGVQQDIYPPVQRLLDLRNMLGSNWPIFLFGGLGIFFFLEDFLLLSLLAILTLLISLFFSASFYTHYLVVIAVPFAIMGGVFFYNLLFRFSFNGGKVTLLRKIILISFIFFSLYQMLYPNLLRSIVLDKTPDFFQIVAVLKKSPQPLFTLQPAYALYARKDLVMYYNTAEMRGLSVTGRNLSYETYHDIIRRSNTILLEPFTNQMLPEGIKEEIMENYSLVYSNDIGSVYRKKL